MSNEPSCTLIICGKHPALGWLAVCLFLNAGSISVFLDLRLFAEINSVAPVLKKKKSGGSRLCNLLLFNHKYSYFVFYDVHPELCVPWLSFLSLNSSLYYYLPRFSCLALFLKVCTLVFNINFSQ